MSRVRFRILAACLALASTAVLPARALAQATTGTIEGQVKDAQGGALPGVLITATNVETAGTFAGATTTDGLYRLTYLPPGTYDVRAELTGFQTQVVKGVVVRLNETSRTNFALALAPLAEEITVTAETPVVQTTKSDLRRTYDEAALREIALPTSDSTGRNVYAVATRTPGVTTPGGRFGRAFLGSGGGNVIANGTTARSTNWELDGISNIDPEDNDYRTPVSLEGVREFEVLGANYNAEFGRAGGAQVRAVSKSGTNSYHGSAFEYFYDNESFQTPGNELQARRCTPDQYAGLATAPAGGCFADFRTHLYGGTFGGPIRRDKIFFFAMFENNVRRGENPATAIVPLPSERGVNTGSVAGDEIMNRWLDLYPLPNRPQINPRRYQTNVPFQYDTPNPLGRVDINLSDSTKVMGRYDFRNQDFKITRVLRGNGGDIVDRAHTGGGTLTRVFGPQTVGEFRFGYAFRRVDLPTERGFEDFPTITVTGFSTLGATSNQFPIFRKLYDYQFVGSVSHSRGRHAFKTGYDIRRTFNNGIQSDAVRGLIGFGVGYGRTGIQNFMAGTPTSYQITIGDPERNFRYWDLGFYVQDDFRIRDNLTLNLGFRNESVTEWQEKDGLTDFGYGADLFNPAPRAGFAYDLTGAGKWVLRSGYGLSYDRVNFFFLRSLQFQATAIRTVTLLPGTEPLRVESLGPTAGTVAGGRVSKSEVDPEFELGRVHTWNVTLERDFARIMSARVSYVGSATRGLPSTLVLNRAVPMPGATVANRDLRRPEAAFSNISRLANASDGNYRALQVSIERRLARGFQYQLSYTWSRALDMASDVGFGGSDVWLSMDESADRTFVLDPEAGMNLRRADLYGQSRFDMRHVGSFNFSYQTPWQRRGGIAGVILSDWTVAGNLAYRDGVPFSVTCSANAGDCNIDGQGQDRPNVVDAGVLGRQFRDVPETIAETRTVHLPIAAFDQTTCGQAGATAACVTPGSGSNLERNVFRRDDFFSTDLAVVRTIPLPGNHRVQLRAEVYNLFNSQVANQPSISFALPDNFGRIFGVDGNRSWQFSAKYLW